MVYVIVVVVVSVLLLKQNTAYEMRISDWSSDVCSSDLRGARQDDALHRAFHQHGDRHGGGEVGLAGTGRADAEHQLMAAQRLDVGLLSRRSRRQRADVRRGGKECVSQCRSRWARDP